MRDNERIHFGIKFTIDIRWIIRKNTLLCRRKEKQFPRKLESFQLARKKNIWPVIESVNELRIEKFLENTGRSFRCFV